MTKNCLYDQSKPLQSPIRQRSRSDAQHVLDPAEIIAQTPRSSLADSWKWFSDRLARAGFESCGFLVSNRDHASPLSSPDSRLFGNVVSADYLKFVRENPDKQANARPYRKLRTSRVPVTYLGDEDLKDSTPNERALAEQVNRTFGIEAWALFPVHAPEKEQISTVGWWDLDDQAEARKLWQAESGTFTLAVTYFAESISGIIDRERSEPSAALSQREIECLLWAGAGKTTGEIANVLNVADGTVEEYFKRAARKLGATTRAQACVRAVLSGLVRP